MRQTLVFRFDRSRILKLGDDYKHLLFYYVDIIEESDIIYYLYNNDLNYFIDKYLILKDDKYILKSLSLDFKYFIEIFENNYMDFILCELNNPHLITEDFENIYHIEFKDYLIFSYTEEDNTIFVESDIDIVKHLSNANLIEHFYFIYKNDKCYLKSFLYSSTFYIEVNKSMTIKSNPDDIEELFYSRICN